MRRIGLIYISVATFAFSAFAKEAQRRYDIEPLDRLVEFQEVQITADFSAAANEIYFYKFFFENPLYRSRYEGVIDKESFLKNLLVMDRGYKSPLLPDYTFMRISGGGNILALCAVYEPELMDVKASEHKLFPQLTSDLVLHKGDKITWDIATLFRQYPTTISAANIKDIANTAIYVYYWCLVGEGYKYEFGERFQGIYVFNDPVGIELEPAYQAIADREDLPEENVISMILWPLPEGGVNEISGPAFYYSFYTWDIMSRELFLWYFVSYSGTDLSIKYIVIGRL